MKRLFKLIMGQKENKVNIIYTEFKRFGDLTSAKGVGRAIKSDSQCLKVMWITAVVGFLAVTIFNVCNLTIEYSQYATGTKITEKKIDMEDTGSDILICNINPYSTELLETTLRKRAEYQKIISDWTSGSEEDEFMNSVKEELLTGQLGFYQYIGPEEASKLSHTWRNFVISCKIHFLDGVLEKSVLCSRTKMKVHKHKDKDYFNCYKILGGEKTKGARPSTGISFLIYIDNVDNYQNDDKGKGAILTIGESGSFLNVAIDGVYIVPGYINTLRFSPVHRNRLKEPHGGCIDKYGKDKKDYHKNGYTLPYLYTEDACLSACIEYNIIQTCGCKDVAQYGILLDVFSNVSMCGALDQGKAILFERMQCVQKWRSMFRKQCVPKCPFPCEEKLFDTSVTYLELSSDQIENKLENEKIKSSVPELNNYEHSEIPDYGKMNRSKFAWVYLKRDRTSYFVVEDTVGMTISDWLAKVGGAMNLWSGITVFVFVEIVDLVFRLVKSMINEVPRAEKRKIGCYCECHGSCRKEDAAKEWEGIKHLHGNKKSVVK